MTEPDEEDSLSSWRLNLKRYGRNHWLVYYQTFLGTPVSNIPRYKRAINLYGEWAVFEAVLAASQQTLTGDPLNYVLKVASVKWKEAQQAEEEEAEYQAEINTAMEATRKRNEELRKKLNASKSNTRKQENKT